jgi:hypothetical protein
LPFAGISFVSFLLVSAAPAGLSLLFIEVVKAQIGA